MKEMAVANLMILFNLFDLTQQIVGLHQVKVFFIDNEHLITRDAMC